MKSLNRFYCLTQNDAPDGKKKLIVAKWMKNSKIIFIFGNGNAIRTPVGKILRDFLLQKMPIGA